MVLNLIKAFFSTKEGREELLGMKAVQPPSEKQILEDANKIVSYANSKAYTKWADEAWAKVLSHIDAIQDEKATAQQVDFHRGALRATLDLLRIAGQAEHVKQQLDTEIGPNVPSVRRT